MSDTPSEPPSATPWWSSEVACHTILGNGAYFATDLTKPWLNVDRRLAIRYFSVAVVLFAAQILFELLAGPQYLLPQFGYNHLDFDVTRMNSTV